MPKSTTTPKKSLVSYAKPVSPMDTLDPAIAQEILDGHAQGIGADRIRAWLHDVHVIDVSRSQVRSFLDRGQRGQAR